MLAGELDVIEDGQKRVDDFRNSLVVARQRICLRALDEIGILLVEVVVVGAGACQLVLKTGNRVHCFSQRVGSDLSVLSSTSFGLATLDFCLSRSIALTSRLTSVARGVAEVVLSDTAC